MVSVASERQGGFTLVELTLALAIMVLLGLSAVLGYRPMIQSHRISKETSLLVGAIREAQVKAVKEGRPWRIRVAADGSSYTMEYAANSAVDLSDCTATADWVVTRTTSFEIGFGIATGNMTRSCIPFYGSGRGGWPNPSINLDESTTPWYDGANALTRLVDGVDLSTGGLPVDPRTDDRAATWRNQNPIILLDAGELRYFDTICVGMFSRPPTYRYPLTVTVEASEDSDPGSATWVTLQSGSGPANGANGQSARTCHSVAVGGSYRLFRFRLTRNGTYVVLDEIVTGSLRFKVEGPAGHNWLEVSPVTGRVTVQS